MAPRSRGRAYATSAVIYGVVVAAAWLLGGAQATSVSNENDLGVWLESNGGAMTGVAVQVQDGGYRGVFATRNIEAGETLISIPFSSCITGDYVYRSPIGRALFEANVYDNELLAIYLLWLRSLGGGDWAPYVETLPATLDAPIFWTRDELEELQVSAVVRDVVRKRRILVERYEQIFVESLFRHHGDLFAPRDAFGFEDFAWAISIHDSRKFRLRTTGIDTPAMVPVFDMLNNGLSVNTEERLHDGALHLVATKAIAAGDEVTAFYGDDPSNAVLLSLYGFVLPGNPAPDAHVDVSAVGTKGNKLSAVKEELLARTGLAGQRFLPVGRPGNIDVDLAAAIRIRLGSARDEKAFLAGTRSPFEAGSKALETRVAREVRKLAQARLASFDTTLSQDEALLGGPLSTGLQRPAGMSWRRWCALVARAGEKATLEAFVNQD